jgi:hypothetical protein
MSWARFESTDSTRRKLSLDLPNPGRLASSANFGVPTIINDEKGVVALKIIDEAVNLRTQPPMSFLGWNQPCLYVKTILLQYPGKAFKFVLDA